MIVYVDDIDDIIITGNDEGELACLKRKLATEFEIKDLGQLKYFLGMEVAQSRKRMVVSQQKYILELLKETGMVGCKLVDTLIDPNRKLCDSQSEERVETGQYQRLVGKLIYLAHTRLDSLRRQSCEPIHAFSNKGAFGSCLSNFEIP